MSETSKTLVLTGFGGHDKLTVEARPVLSPGPGQVLVNVRATGINFAELMCRQGIYNKLPKLPAVLGNEGAGVVTQVGPDVTNVKVGDEVICMASFSTSPGLWQEYAIVLANKCFPMAKGMTFEEAAAIPVNYITAYHMLFELGNLRPGNKVLVHMAAGGVGVAATQLCHTVPDVTVFGTASAAKHDVIKKGGVNYPIDYRTQDYAEEIKKISPEGVDIVLDPLSGSDSGKSYDLLKPFGKIIHFGAANVMTGKTKSWWSMIWTYMGLRSFNPLKMITENKAIAGYHLGYLTKHPELVRSAALTLVDLYKQEKIKPVIDSVWAFEDVDKAMSQMEERRNIGKVILSPQKKPVKR